MSDTEGAGGALAAMAGRQHEASRPHFCNAVIFVHGINPDVSWYQRWASLLHGETPETHPSGARACTRYFGFRWGSDFPIPSVASLVSPLLGLGEYLVNGGTPGLMDVYSDQLVAPASDALAKLLHAIDNAIGRGGHISIVAHSLGTRVVCNCIARLKEQLVDSTILLAPAIDADTSGLDAWGLRPDSASFAATLKAKTKVVVARSSGDWALFAGVSRTEFTFKGLATILRPGSNRRVGLALSSDKEGIQDHWARGGPWTSVTTHRFGHSDWGNPAGFTDAMATLFRGAALAESHHTHRAFSAGLARAFIQEIGRIDPAGVAASSANEIELSDVTPLTTFASAEAHREQVELQRDERESLVDVGGGLYWQRLPFE